MTHAPKNRVVPLRTRGTTRRRNVRQAVNRLAFGVDRFTPALGGDEEVLLIPEKWSDLSLHVVIRCPRLAADRGLTGLPLDHAGCYLVANWQSINREYGAYWEYTCGIRRLLARRSE